MKPSDMGVFIGFVMIAVALSLIYTPWIMLGMGVFLFITELFND